MIHEHGSQSLEVRAFCQPFIDKLLALGYRIPSKRAHYRWIFSPESLQSRLECSQHDTPSLLYSIHNLV